MVRIFLVTANVGSVFENLDKGLSTWMNEFISVIRSKEPEFVAVHFQETGGKNYENGSNVISIFFGHLVERMGEINFRRAEGFVDSRSDLEDQFTALSSIYFVHESVHQSAIGIWDFQEQCFKDIPRVAKVHIGRELEVTGRKQKEKFPQNFYPNCKWSRKGFLRTRWRIEGKVLDFVNIHLFHDSDNVIAASSFPSQFAQSREKTLNYTLKRLQNDSLERCPMFVFGDFNFRVNTEGVMNILKRDYGDPNTELSQITLRTKKFDCPDQELRFLHSYDWLKKYDFEVNLQDTNLQEFDLNFHPSYPFEENGEDAEKYLRTRIPAWCDRVLYTHTTKDIISQESPIEYNLIGSKACMGDHKPVFLSFTLSSNTTLHSNNKPHELVNSITSRGQSSGTVRSLSSESSFSSCCSTSTNSSKAAMTNSSLGTPQNVRCKCLVSLFKCNLGFSKSNKKSSSKSPSDNSAPHSSKVSRFSKPFWKCHTKSSRNNTDQSHYHHEEDLPNNDASSINEIHIAPLIITEKPSSIRPNNSSEQHIVLPISVLQLENDKNSKSNYNGDVQNIQMSVNIQDLNVISSNIDKSTSNNNNIKSKSKRLQNTKLPFGWTNKMSRRKNSSRQNSVETKGKNKKEIESLSEREISKNSDCTKCAIL